MVLLKRTVIEFIWNTGQLSSTLGKCLWSGIGSAWSSYETSFNSVDKSIPQLPNNCLKLMPRAEKLLSIKIKNRLICLSIETFTRINTFKSLTHLEIWNRKRLSITASQYTHVKHGWKQLSYRLTFNEEIKKYFRPHDVTWIVVLKWKLPITCLHDPSQKLSSHLLTILKQVQNISSKFNSWLHTLPTNIKVLNVVLTNTVSD